MAYLTNNSASDIIKKLYEEFTGKELTSAAGPSLKDIVDVGDTSGNILKDTEQFFKALFDVVIKTWYTDSSYRNTLNDPWLVDKEVYGGILQSISIEAPDIRPSSSWTTFTSGETEITDTDIIYIPQIEAKLYGAAIAYELPIAISENQVNEAMRNAGELETLVSYIMVAVDNKLTVYMESLNQSARNQYIEKKFEATSGSGTHVVNLVKDYCDAFNITTGMTAAAFLKNADAMRWASKRFDHYKRRLAKMSGEYNVDGKQRFTPSDRLVFQVNSDFEEIMASTAYSTTYNPEYITMSGYEVLPFWQYSEAGIDSTSHLPKSMNVKTKDGSTTNIRRGIVGFMADKWAIRHTIVEETVRAHHFDRHAVTQYYYQFKNKHDIDLSLNAIVFTIADVAA